MRATLSLMRRLLRFLVAVLGPLGAIQALAQTPVPLPVTGNLSSIVGSPVAYAGLDVQLQNCPSPVAISGYWGIVQQEYQVQANASGMVSFNLWPNDLITCNSTTGNSQYLLSILVNGAVQGTPQCYQIVSTQGSWNINGPQQPIPCSQPPPNPQDASYRNINSTGFFQGNNGAMSGDWTAQTFYSLGLAGDVGDYVTIGSGGQFLATPFPSNVVNQINGTSGAFTFGGAGVSCVTTTCTFSAATTNGINLLNNGAFCDSNGTTGNGHNDRAAIQAVLSGLSATLGAQIIIPSGHICRIASTDTTINTDYLSVAVSNLEITGGGALFFDPVLVSGHPTFGTAISGIYAAGLQIYSPGCTLSPVSNPQDITTGRTVTTLISNINLHDFSMTSVGSYNSLIWNNSGEPGTNIPLNNVGIAIWCANNVQIHHMNVSNFFSDAIEPWGIVGLSVTGNLITNVGFNGLGSGWTSDYEISNNTMVGVGQGFEVEALRTSFTGNVVSRFAMSGIEAIGGPTAGTNVSTTISGNTLARDTTVAEGRNGISVSCNGATSTCVDNADIGPDVLYGSYGAGVYVQPGKAVSVHNITGTFTAAAGSPIGAIQVEEGSTWGVLNPVTVENNTLNFTSSFYQSAIYATGLASSGVQSIVQGNSITSPGFAGGTAWGVYQFSTGLECQQWNYSSAALAPNLGCPLPAAGTTTLASGTATVTTTQACAHSSTCVYKLANCGVNSSSAVGTPSVGTVVAGTSFVINSLNSSGAVATGDVSCIAWQIN